MIRLKNKDGTIDYLMSKKDFYEKYVFGCIWESNDRWIKVRVRGEVPDLKNVVIKKGKEVE